MSNWLKNEQKIVIEKKGDDVFVGGNGRVQVYTLTNDSTPYSSINFGYDNTKPIFVNRTSFVPITREYVVNDSISLKNVSDSILHSRGDVDVLVVNVTANVDFKSWHEHMNVFNPNYGLLIINGNGHNITLSGGDEDDEYHFALVNKTSLLVNDLCICGFNCAVMNYGVCGFNNVSFTNNRVKYTFTSGDEAGAINNFGLLTCVNCTFLNNKGNWAGAIYSANGAITNLTNCTFIKNTQCKGSDGGDLYNYNFAHYYTLHCSKITEDSNITSVTTGYGYLPFGTRQKLFNIVKVGTFLVSAVSPVIGTVVGGVPGAWVGFAIGTVLGTALDLGVDTWYYNSMHDFNGFSPADVITSLSSHCGIALIFTGVSITAYTCKPKKVDTHSIDRSYTEVGQNNNRNNNRNNIINNYPRDEGQNIGNNKGDTIINNYPRDEGQNIGNGRPNLLDEHNLQNDVGLPELEDIEAERFNDKYPNRMDWINPDTKNSYMQIQEKILKYDGAVNGKNVMVDFPVTENQIIKSTMSVSEENFEVLERYCKKNNLDFQLVDNYICLEGSSNNLPELKDIQADLYYKHYPQRIPWVNPDNYADYMTIQETILSYDKGNGNGILVEVECPINELEKQSTFIHVSKQDLGPLEQYSKLYNLNFRHFKGVNI